MQQQFQADPDSLRQALPSHSPRYSTKRQPKEREISPWGSVEESKKTFNPSQYYETITSELRETQRQHRNRSTPLTDSRQQALKRRQQGLGPFLRNSRNAALSYHERSNEENPLKMNLVTVNLDEEAVSPDRRLGRTLDSFQLQRQREEGKEQPMRVRIFKKIQQKNQQAEEEYSERAGEFLQELEGQQLSPFGSIDGNSIYQAMPKRSVRIAYQRPKGHSVLETARHDFLPKISIQKEKGKGRQKEEFFCKGEIITSKKEVQSMRRMNFRSAQLDSEHNREGVLFLKKYSYQP